MTIAMLKFFTFVGLAHGGRVPALEWRASDSPVVALPLTPNYACTLDTPITSLIDFEDTYDSLTGPCRFVLSRTYTADNISRYLNYEDARATLVVHLQAPAGLQSLITQVHIEQDELLSAEGCSDLRVSRWRGSRTSVAPFIHGFEAADSAKPDWDNRGGHQLVEGDYLFNFPSRCLLQPRKLLINILYIHEPAASTYSLTAPGTLTSFVEDCPLARKSFFASYEDLLERLGQLPNDCLYEYSRDYLVSVSESNIYEHENELRLLAEPSLIEPMWPGQRRQIAALELAGVDGAECQRATVYVRKKRVAEDDTPSISVDQLKPLAVNKSLIANLEGDIGDGTREFLFVLPKDCDLVEPMLKFSVFDFNDVPDTLAHADSNVLQDDDAELLKETFDTENIKIEAEIKSEPGLGTTADKCSVGDITVPTDSPDFDAIVDKLPSGCFYTFSETVPIAKFANVKFADSKWSIGIVAASETDLNFGPTKGTRLLGGITVKDLECYVGDLKIFTLQKFDGWGDFTGSESSVTNKITAEHTLTTMLQDEEAPKGGHVVQVDAGCYDKENISGEIVLTSRVYKGDDEIKAVEGTPQKATPTVETGSCPEATEVTELDDFAAFLAEVDRRSCEYSLERHLKGDMEPTNVRPPNADADQTGLRLAIRLSTSNILSDYVAASFDKLEISDVPTSCTTYAAVQYETLEKWTELPDPIKTSIPKREDKKIVMTDFAAVGDSLNVVLNLTPGDCLTTDDLNKMTFELTTTAKGTRKKVESTDPKVGEDTTIVSSDDTKCPVKNQKIKNIDEFAKFIHDEDTTCKFTLTLPLTVELAEGDILGDRLAFVLSSKELILDANPDIAYELKGLEISGLADSVCTDLPGHWFDSPVKTWNDLFADDSVLKDRDLVHAEQGLADLPLTEADVDKAYVLGDVIKCFTTKQITVSYSAELTGQGENLKIPELLNLESDKAKPTPVEEENCVELNEVTDLKGFENDLKTDGSVYCNYKLDLSAKAELEDESKQVDGENTFIGFQIPQGSFSVEGNSDIKTKLVKITLDGLGSDCNDEDFSISTSEEITMWNDRDKAEKVTDSNPKYASGSVEFTLKISTNGPLVCIIESPSKCLKSDSMPKVTVGLSSQGKGLTQKALPTDFDIKDDQKGRLATECYLPVEETTMTDLKELMKTRSNKCDYTLSRRVKADWKKDNWYSPYAAFFPPKFDDDESKIASIEIELPNDNSVDTSKCGQTQIYEPKRTKLVVDSWSHLREVLDSATPPDMRQLIGDWEKSSEFKVEVVDGESGIKNLRIETSSETTQWDTWLVLLWPSDCSPSTPLTVIYSEIETTLTGESSSARHPSELDFADTKGDVTSLCYVKESEETLGEFSKSLASRSPSCEFSFDQLRPTPPSTTEDRLFTYEKPNFFINVPDKVADDKLKPSLLTIILTDLMKSTGCTLGKILSFDDAPDLDHLTGTEIKDVKATTKGNDMVIQYTGTTSLFAKYLAIAVDADCDGTKASAISLEIGATGQGTGKERRPADTDYGSDTPSVSAVGAYCSDYHDDGTVKTMDDFKTFLAAKPTICLFKFEQQYISTDLKLDSNSWHMPNDEKVEQTNIVFSMVKDETPSIAMLTLKDNENLARSLSAMILTLKEDVSGSPDAKSLSGASDKIDLDNEEGDDLKTFVVSTEEKLITLKSTLGVGEGTDPEWVLVKADGSLTPSIVTLVYDSQGRGQKESTNPATPLHLMNAPHPESTQADCQTDIVLGSNDFAYFLTNAKRGCRYTLLTMVGGDLSSENLFITKSNQVGVAFELPVKQLRSQSRLYTTGLQSILIELGKDCGSADATVFSIPSRPSPLNDNLFKDALDVTTQFSITLVDNSDGTSGKSLQLEMVESASLDVDRSSIIVTLDQTCDTDSTVVPITFNIHSEGEGIAIDTSGTSSRLGLIGLLISILMATSI